MPMDAARWAEVRRCFEDAVQQDPATRDAWLARECPDPELRAQVQAMLRADAAQQGTGSVTARAERLLDQIGDAIDAPPDDAGRQVGPWRLLRCLGEGGMGSVWLAERVEGGYTQRVALKRMRAGWSSGELARRFRQERQILATLEHPHIARLIDGGTTASGEPFLALEYVEGEDLRCWCDTRRLGVDARLRLFLTVCEAVEYAHSRLVVHRDLKPSNILVTQDGRVKLLDFGVAKLLDEEAAGEGTAANVRLYTPGYAAPEQVRGEACTTAVDVFALGVVLYELLAGRRPFDPGRRGAALEHAVLTEDPPPPSQAITRRREDGAAEAITAPPAWRTRLRGDLDAIVLRALRKAPGERYASVRALADDVRAHLQRRPVAARRGNWRYRAGRFLQRHAVAVALGLVALASLCAGLGAALWQAREARAQRDLAEAQAATAEQALAFMQSVFEMADPGAAGGTVDARDLLRQGLERVEQELAGQPLAHSALLRAIGMGQNGLGEWAAAEQTLERSLQLARESGDPVAERRALLAYAHVIGMQSRNAEVKQLLAPLHGSWELRTTQDQVDAARLEELLAFAHFNLAELDAAGRYFRDALQRSERLYGPVHPRTQSVMRGHVAQMLLQGREEQALELAQRALDALPRHTDRPNALRVSALTTLAMVQAARGEHEAVLALRQEALELTRAIYGEQHADYYLALNNVAVAYSDLGRYAETSRMLDLVIAGRRERADLPGLAHALYNASVAATRGGDPERGRVLAEESLALRQGAGARHGVGLLQAHHAMAMALLALGRTGEAAPQVEASLRLRREVYGDDSVQLVPALAQKMLLELLRGTVSDCAPVEQARTLAGPESTPRGVLLDGLDAACRAELGEHGAMARLEAALRAARDGGPSHAHELRVLQQLYRRVR